MADTTFHFSVDTTAWVLVSGSHESRHLYDIIFAIDVLRKKGVSSSKIFVFSDHPATSTELGPFAITENVLSLSDLTSRISEIGEFEHLGLVVTGHGDGTGISAGDGSSTIKPLAALTAVRSCRGVKAAFMLLTQCYAGVFDRLHVAGDPPVVIIGATNLNPSLSCRVQLDPPVAAVSGPGLLKEWSANIFMLDFFNWLRHPVDVDGDGNLTLLDAYKYAGVSSNRRLREAKSRLHFSVQALSAEILEQAVTAGAFDITHELRLLSLRQKLSEQLDLLHTHQEPWSLHADLLRRIHFT